MDYLSWTESWDARELPRQCVSKEERQAEQEKEEEELFHIDI